MILDPDYARIFTQARCVAWQYGYTCAAIGSFTRDLDLLLVPWEDRAYPNHEQLLKLIAMACGLRFRDGEEDILKAKPDFTDKPHGRKSCSLFFKEPSDRRWVDIGIVPCTPKGSAAGHEEYASWQHGSGVSAWREPISQDPATRAQVASVMLAHGTPEQQAEALRTCGVKTPGEPHE